MLELGYDRICGCGILRYEIVNQGQIKHAYNKTKTRKSP